MKKLLLCILMQISLAGWVFGYDVSGKVLDSETGESLAGIDLYLDLQSGQVKTATTQADGTFTFNYVPDGMHQLVFHDISPVMINGDYYLYTEGPDVFVNGANVTGINFPLDPHHPVYQVTGTLYDALTNQPLINQNVSLRLDFFAHSGFFFAWLEDDGTYTFADFIPDWTYTFNVFENDYYEGDEMILTIDSISPELINIDFYLQPKDGVSVSGRLFDISTNEPILMANRTIRLDAINSLFTETNEDGKFMFVNVDPGYYPYISVTSEDTAYINCPQSTIYDITVPSNGLGDIQLYQTPFETVHKVHVYDKTFTPGESKTFQFSLVQSDLAYGAIWGVELIVPDGMTALNTQPFYRYSNGQQVFDYIGTCYSGDQMVWEGYHSVFGSGNVGNLQALNDSVYADVEFQFDPGITQNPAIFYHVFYNYACTGGPYSYGYIVLGPDNNKTLNLKAMLEGPFNGSEMMPGMSLDFPLTQPFNTAPWNYVGSESVDNLPNSNVVDWILVELRDATSPTTATGATMVDRQAAFILNDGTITAMDGASPIQMPATINNNLYVVLWHHNHIGVLSNYPVVEISGVYSYDFTIGMDQAYGGTSGHKELAPGIWGMRGGDSNHDGLINEIDLAAFWQFEAGRSGYLEFDFNCDGHTDNLDKNDVWFQNIGSGSSIPE